VLANKESKKSANMEKNDGNPRSQRIPLFSRFQSFNLRKSSQNSGTRGNLLFSLSNDKVYKGRGSRSEESSYRRVRQTNLILKYALLPDEIESFKRLAGWRLYVTNATQERLSLTEAVSAYQEQWQPERGFHRFKKGRLSALPIYFRDEEKIKGLMFLLTIALRLFTLMEFVVRRQLHQCHVSTSYNNKF
jgi:transposase